MSDYEFADSLVSTRWAEAHLNVPAVKFVEVNFDQVGHETGRIPGALSWNWLTDFNSPFRRDIVEADAFAELNRAGGIDPDDTVVLYGHSNNWFAAGALWIFNYYGHRDVRLLDGSGAKWRSESRPLSASNSRAARRSFYPVPWVDQRLRADRGQVEAAVNGDRVNLVDARSAEEFNANPDSPFGAVFAHQANHITGAINVPSSQIANVDGTFKTIDEMRQLYFRAGLNFARPTIVYCRTGGCASYTWFVLKYLLRLPEVRVYDGSWLEWNSNIGMEIRPRPRNAQELVACVA